MLAYRRACHGAIPHNGAISSTLHSYSGCCIHRLSLNSSKSLIVLEASLGTAKVVTHQHACNKISAAFYMFGKVSLSTQLDVYSPSPVNLPVSKCYAPVA